MTTLRNPHPGEILKEEFLNEISMSQNQLGHAIGVPPRDRARPQRTWQRMKRELEDMALPTGLKFAAVRHVDAALGQFQTVHMQDYKANFQADPEKARR